MVMRCIFDALYLVWDTKPVTFVFYLILISLESHVWQILYYPIFDIFISSTLSTTRVPFPLAWRSGDLLSDYRRMSSWQHFHAQGAKICWPTSSTSCEYGYNWIFKNKAIYRVPRTACLLGISIELPANSSQTYPQTTHNSWLKIHETCTLDTQIVCKVSTENRLQTLVV